ncbi:uncharacterized protein F5147DRAFT_774208 [Suillus discolor]|uniref:C2H2-type domain-containing protein n=1 Tax=Suillus discolor TaxID=1912936 RepID=A0A9P7F4U4_9AGAM|nr:uncharacterized protein F5147DRAFT_774208 [Suillus discolor]KAG2107377.1 hypothetical protein F5147DRAFT_774208 [Suillus discolor]
MSDNDVCDHPGCGMGPFPTYEIARKHRYRYHSVPITFLIDGNEHVVGQSDGRYTCPLPECKIVFKKREAIQKHINVVHNDSVKIKVFDASEFDVPSSMGHTTARRRVYIRRVGRVSRVGLQQCLLSVSVYLW